MARNFIGFFLLFPPQAETDIRRAAVSDGVPATLSFFEQPPLRRSKVLKTASLIYFKYFLISQPLS